MDPAAHFLSEAIALARANVEAGGRPFGAVVVKDGAVVARGVNEIIATRDPTAHAELNALRAASQALGTTNLAGCVVYASGQPCPMCLAAMWLSGVSEAAYAFSNADGEPYGLSTARLYAELARPFEEQAMPIRHAPDAARTCPDLYADWASRQRRVH